MDSSVDAHGEHWSGGSTEQRRERVCARCERVVIGIEGYAVGWRVGQIRDDEHRAVSLSPDVRGDRVVARPKRYEL